MLSNLFLNNIILNIGNYDHCFGEKSQAVSEAMKRDKVTKAFRFGLGLTITPTTLFILNANLIVMLGLPPRVRPPPPPCLTCHIRIRC